MPETSGEVYLGGGRCRISGSRAWKAARGRCTVEALQGSLRRGGPQLTRASEAPEGGGTSGEASSEDPGGGRPREKSRLGFGQPVAKKDSSGEVSGPGHLKCMPELEESIRAWRRELAARRVARRGTAPRRASPERGA